MDPAELQRLLDQERADAAALERMRERSLLRQVHEEGRLAGVLASLQAHGWEASVQTTLGRVHRGPVAAVAADYCSLAAPPGQVHVPYTGLASLRPAAPASGQLLVDAEPAVGGDAFAELLARLAEDRAHVHVGLLGAAELLTGTLETVGADVLTITLDAAGAPSCYVAASSVVELSVGRGSG